MLHTHAQKLRTFRIPIVPVETLSIVQNSARLVTAETLLELVGFCCDVG